MTTNKTTDALFPCPFCGEGNSQADDGGPIVYYSRCEKYRYCECDNCGARTADADTKEDAIEFWQTRAQPKPAQGDETIAHVFIMGQKFIVRRENHAAFAALIEMLAENNGEFK